VTVFFVQQSVEKTAIFLTALGLGVLIEDDFMERETGASRDDEHNQLGFVPFFSLLHCLIYTYVH